MRRQGSASVPVLRPTVTGLWYGARRFTPSSTANVSASGNQEATTVTIRALHLAFLLVVLALIPSLAFSQEAKRGAVSQIALGGGHACAITQESALYCWGGNKDGQVGSGQAGADVVAPALIFPDGVTQVAAGFDDTCAIVRGALWCWGNNGVGQVKAGLGAHVDKPAQILPNNVTSVAMSRGGVDQTCAIVAGALRCWGFGARKPDAEIFHAGVTAVDVSSLQDCAIVRGALMCWDNTNKAPPKEMLHAGATSVAVRSHRACALVSGALWCWGDNADGEIGNGQKGDFVSQPVRVLDSGVSAVAIGDNHACAIRNGALLCWGNKSSFAGQYGGQHLPGIVPKPTVIIPGGVGALAENYFDDLCVVVAARLRCRSVPGGNQHHQILRWPNVDTSKLPLDTGIGDIDALAPDTPAKLAVPEKQALDQLAALVAKRLKGALVSEGNNVYRVSRADMAVDHGVLVPTLVTLPLYPIRRASEDKANGSLLRFHATLPEGAVCGKPEPSYVRYWMSWSYGLYVQADDRFTLAADAFHDLARCRHWYFGAAGRRTPPGPTKARLPPTGCSEDSTPAPTPSRANGRGNRSRHCASTRWMGTTQAPRTGPRRSRPTPAMCSIPTSAKLPTAWSCKPGVACDKRISVSKPAP
ncbi:RCC1 domain-containing protein [Dyella agri]|uniref:Uncharacterized protein n=1 Tax=Dyella agri TaxID=1926869 RepID=A0ABW8KBN4_9GAMM